MHTGIMAHPFSIVGLIENQITSNLGVKPIINGHTVKSLAQVLT